MLSVKSLIKRMKRCNPGAKCGVSFGNNDEVVLHWTISLTRIYELTFKEHQLTVECNSFQRAIKQAELDMKGGL